MMYGLHYWKTWRIRKELTHKNKALKYCENTEYKGLGRLLAESLKSDIKRLKAELESRK